MISATTIALGRPSLIVTARPAAASRRLVEQRAQQPLHACAWHRSIAIDSCTRRRPMIHSTTLAPSARNRSLVCSGVHRDNSNNLHDRVLPLLLGRLGGVPAIIGNLLGLHRSSQHLARPFGNWRRRHLARICRHLVRYRIPCGMAHCAWLCCRILVCGRTD